MINFKKSIQNISMAADGGSSPNLAPSNGGSRGNIESQMQV